MNIQFLGPPVPASDGGISYRALVDGATIACKFSCEALQDVDPSNATDSAMNQFEANMSLLLSMAKEKILAGEVENGVVYIFTKDLSS